MMHSKALVAATIALSSLQLGCTPLLAKPTRTFAHPTVARPLVAQPSQRLVRERAAHAAAVRPHTATHASAPSHRALPTAERKLVSARRPAAPTLASNTEADRVHAWIRSQQTHTRVEQPSIYEQPRRSLVAARTLRRAPRAARSTLAQQRRSTAPSPLLYNSASTDDEPFASISNTPRDVDRVYAAASNRSRSIDQEAASPLLLPSQRISSLYDSRGRLIVPPPLLGSHENLLHQNEMADRDGLDRIRDDADLLDLRREQKLVAIPENSALRVDARLPENRRFSRPWTATFLAVLSHDYYATFHQPLQVDSAVRTIAVQQHLTRINGNAAPSTGDNASPHLTGQAVDIAKRGLSRTQIAWMRTYLQPLIEQGKIDVEEEFQQACFHISVYRNYVPIAPLTLATAR
jgi:hypothetical protein